MLGSVTLKINTQHTLLCTVVRDTGRPAGTSSGTDGYSVVCVERLFLRSPGLDQRAPKARSYPGPATSRSP